MAALEFHVADQAQRSSEELRGFLDDVRGVTITDAAFGDQVTLATAMKDKAVSVLEQRIAAAEQAERDALELRRLRAEEAERQRVADEARAKEAAERRAQELAAEDLDRLLRDL